jgi:hypothetical protein
MRIASAASQRLAHRGSFRTRGGRIATSTKLLTAVLVAATSMTALVVAESAPASASTLNGIATIANPTTLAFLTSGASTTPFTVTLPSLAACDGDTATHGYHVYSYLVPSGTNLSSVTFQSSPSTGFGLVDNIGTYYGPVNTAIGTGQIIGIPNGFRWGPLVANDGIPLSTLLYTGSGPSASGVWEAGLVCANSSGAVADNWNTEVTFLANAGDTNGFTWTAVPGPSGSTPAAFTSASSTSFFQGSAGTFAPTASGSPTPVITESGTLPAGVTFTGGVLSGTPTVSGTFPITLTATNGIEAPAHQSFTLNVVPPPTVTSVSPSSGLTAGGTSVVITGTNLGSATAVDFGANAASITADSATSVTATSPAGSVGTFDVTVTTPAGTSITSVNDQFTYGTAPAFTSATKTQFVMGVAGTFTPTATGTPTPTITESGALPAGVTFTGGVLSGTPTVKGKFPITFTASNGFGPPVTQSFTLKVVFIEITTTSLPVATRGTAYSATLGELGGVGPFTWKSNVALPAGLTLHATKGTITGTTSATAAIGTFSIVFTVTDSATPTKHSASVTLSLKVKA